MLARLGFCICPLISLVGTVAVHATDIPALVQRAKPAVVEILTFDQQNDLLKSGTGFFISPDGILLTNYHVISGGSGIIAKTPTGAVYILKSVVSYSEAHDVAELQFLTTDAPYLTLGHSSGAVEGQRVLVIGNPVGLEGTVSEGIISAFRAGRTLIQITAPISPGSSGSPVLDESGQVIGMAILVYREGQNLNFAISSETIRDAIAKSAIVTPNPSVSAATPTPSPIVVATPTPSVAASIQRPTAIGAKWPDGRKLLHPDQFVRTRVVNVDANDTLKLRSGPGTSFRVVAEIPAGETNVTAFNYDQIWDGDTWWCPVEWRGLRGYVGRSHLPKP
jgi:S1-C subfamily serine protease